MKKFENTFTRFDTMHERDRHQTDGQTDTARRHRPRLQPGSLLPRDAMHKRGLPSCGIRSSVCLSVCLSVYVSVTFMYSIETNKRIFNFFSPSGSHTILVFPHQTLWKYSDEDPIPGAKIVIFDQYLAWHPSLLDHRVSLTFPQ